MKIITILLLIISTQVLAEKRGILDNATSGQSTSYFTVEQCNQIANISKRTIKAAISGVPIAEVIEKFGNVKGWSKDKYNPDGANWRVYENKLASQDTHTMAPPPNTGSRLSDDNTAGVPVGGSGTLNNWRANGDGVQASSEGTIALSNGSPARTITAIYKTVKQVKTKYGQVRPQDRARLNKRVEQKLMECREMANLEDTKNLDNDYND